MAYDIKFNVAQTGAETIDQITAKMTVMKAQITATGVEMRQTANRVADAEKQMAEAVTAGHTKIADEISKVATEERAALDGLVVKQRELKASLDELTPATNAAAAATVKQAEATAVVTEATTRMVPAVAAANAEFALMEGRLPTRALGQFATNVLGLGPILQNAFPLFGLFALGDVIVQTGVKLLAFIDKFEPLRQAENRAAETTKSLTSDFKKLNDEIARMATESFEDTHGKTAGLAHQAAMLVNGSIGDRVFAGGLTEEIAALQKRKLTEDSDYTRRGGGSASLSPMQRAMGPLPQKGALNPITGLHLVSVDPKTGVKTYDDAPIDVDIATMQQQLSLFQKQSQVTAGTADHLSHESLKAQDAATTEADRKEAEAKSAARQASNAVTTGLRTGDDEGLAKLKSNHELSLAEIKKYWEARLKLESGNAVRVREITGKIGDVTQQQYKAEDRFIHRGDAAKAEADKKAGAATNKTFSILNDTSLELDQGYQEYVKADVEKRTKIADLQGRGSEIQTTGAAQMSRLGVQRTAGTNTDSSQKVAMAIWEQSQIAQIDAKEGADRIAAEKSIQDRIKDAYGEGSVEYLTQSNKLLEITNQTNEKRFSAETKLLEDIASARERADEKYRKDAESIFDALTNRQVGAGRALGLLLKKDALSEGGTLFGNVTAPILKSAGEGIASAIPASMGKILHGTVFDPANKAIPDAAQAAIMTNTAEAAASLKHIDQNTSGDPAAASSAPPGVSPGGAASSATGILGGLTSAASSGGAGVIGTIAKALGSVGGGIGSVFSGNALSMLLGQTETQDASGNWNPTSTSDRVGAGVGLAGTLGAGAFGIISGIHAGGAGGALTAAGSAIGTAAAITTNVAKLMGAVSPFLSAVPVIGSIAAIALPLIGSLLGTGPVQRANQINQELSANQYIAPQALNVTQSSNGNFTDFNARGQIRTSDFSAVPTVRQGSVWEQTHGLFGPPPTYYNVPGTQTGQFNASSAAKPTTVINVTTMDAGSFADFADKHHIAIGNAAAKNLQNVHGSLATEVHRTANG
jgi:hypothetical protein